MKIKKTEVDYEASQNQLKQFLQQLKNTSDTLPLTIP